MVFNKKKVCNKKDNTKCNHRDDLPKHLQKDRDSLSLLYRRARFRVSWFMVGYKLLVAALFFLLNCLAYFPFWLLRIEFPLRLKSFFHSSLLRICGITYRVHGSPLKRGSVLYVCNHASYLDISALMSLAAPRFLAREDILRLPLAGWLMRGYGTIGIKRIREQASEQVSMLRSLFSHNEPLLVFAEGTTGDGREVLPMKSSLFAAFDKPSRDIETGSIDEDIYVQPISLRYSLLDGVPMGTCWEPFCAWYGNMYFIPHALELLSLHRITMDVYIHPARKASQIASDRKGIARFCEKTVRDGLSLLRYKN